MKLLHLADIHLGKKFSWLKQDAGKHRARIWNTFEKSLKYAQDNSIPVIIICGDIFDSPYPSQEQIDKFDRLIDPILESGVNIVILPGNHDRAEQGSVWNQYPERKNLSIFKTNEFSKLELPELNINLFARAITTQNSANSPISGFNKVINTSETQGQINIVLAHGALDIGKKSSGVIKSTEIEELSELGIDYLALGDWHGFQQRKIANLQLAYPGSIEYLDSTQNNSGFGLIVEIDKDKTNTTITQQKFSELELIHKNFKLEQTEQKIIENEISNLMGDSKIFKAKISGNTKLEQRMSKFIDQLYKRFSNKFYYFDVIDNTDLKVNSQDLENFPEGSIPNEFIKIIDQKTKSGDIDGDIAEEVLELGISTLTD
jgi:DNA repair exonuclease SbcCD nuclease subunit